MNNPDENKWKEQLTPEQYAVMQKGETEAPFSSSLNDNKETGMYHCAACGSALFSSEEKFESGTGWPSFTKAISDGAIETRPDDSAGMNRTEVVCAACGSHLGHLFPDGPTKQKEESSYTPTGNRLCINGCPLNFQQEGREEDR